MNIDEMNILREQRNDILIDGSMLQNQEDRTLLWGYTSHGNSWHVYLMGGVIHYYVYTNDQQEQIMKDSGSYPPQALIPDKRLYPEACDFEFCKLLKVFGVHLPFTGFNEQRPLKKFYGALIPS